jgi:hypothetical protein
MYEDGSMLEHRAKYMRAPYGLDPQMQNGVSQQLLNQVVYQNNPQMSTLPSGPTRRVSFEVPPDQLQQMQRRNSITMQNPPNPSYERRNSLTGMPQPMPNYERRNSIGTAGMLHVIRSALEI